jgi:flagellar basal body-associated protein FliL
MNDEKKPDDNEAKPKSDSELKAKSGPNIFIIIAIIIVANIMFVTIGFVAMHFLFGEKEDKLADELINPDSIKVEEAVEVKTNLVTEVILPIKADVVVNIAGTDGMRFLKARISVAYDSKARENKNIEANLAGIETQLKSKVNEYLSSLTLEQVNSPSIRQSIRTTLLADLNSMLPAKAGKLSNVYVEEFIIQ